MNACKTLGQLGPKGGEVAARALLDQLDTRAGRVRAAAVAALGQIVDASNWGVIAALLSDKAEQGSRAYQGNNGMSCVKGNPTLRATIIKIFGQIAQKGDHLAISAVTARLQDENGLVRAAAAHALAQLSDGDQISDTAGGEDVRPGDKAVLSEERQLRSG